MYYKVSFLIKNDEDATEDEFKEWVRAEMYGDFIDENNPLEFKIFETRIEDFKIDKVEVPKKFSTCTVKSICNVFEEGNCTGYPCPGYTYYDKGIKD